MTARHKGALQISFCICIALHCQQWSSIAALASIRQYHSITIESGKWQCTYTLMINRLCSDNSAISVIARPHYLGLHVEAYMPPSMGIHVSFYKSPVAGDMWTVLETCRQLLSTSCLSVKKTVALYSLCELCRWLSICLVPCRKVQPIVCGNECW